MIQIRTYDGDEVFVEPLVVRKGFAIHHPCFLNDEGETEFNTSLFTVTHVASGYAIPARCIGGVEFFWTTYDDCWKWLLKFTMGVKPDDIYQDSDGWHTSDTALALYRRLSTQYELERVEEKP